MSEQMFPFTSSRDHYEADACVVWCFDDRFYKLLKAFGKHVGFNHIDLVKVAGGAKALAEDDSSERNFVLSQILASIRLHGTKKIILMLHRDCGAYGGSKQFSNSEQETAYYEDRLRTAKNFVSKEVSIPVEAYFADFDGLREVA